VHPASIALGRVFCKYPQPAAPNFAVDASSFGEPANV
jgi:hypothetical protein